MSEDAIGQNNRSSIAAQLRQFGLVFLGCLAVGVGIGFIQGVFAFWREEFQYTLFLSVLAAIAGGAVGLLEGLALYLFTHRYLRYEDYRSIALIALAGGCLTAGLLSVVNAGIGSMLITPLITLIATISLLIDRYRKRGRLR